MRTIYFLNLLVLVTCFECGNVTKETLAVQVASELKQGLQKELRQKMEMGGEVAAIQYCNLKAIPLSLEISKSTGFQIRRITNKPRNQINLMTERELRSFELIQSEFSKTGKYNPLVETFDGATHVYIPITIGENCLVCHGEPGRNVKPKTIEILKKLYPMDKALDYKLGDLRGLFDVKIN
ncbi:DUF3365 domain-containing protein [Leptospira sp. 96542]|nr:DUF3365 domain-containing protein [Leptospira sp. 96542]